MGGVRVTIYRNTSVNPSVNDAPIQETTLQNEKNTLISEETTLKTSTKILSVIENNPYVTREELAEKLSLSIKGIEWQIKTLKDKGFIIRVGSDKNGYWQIITRV